MSDKEMAARIAIGMYANEPCRICGERITEADLSTAVFAGYSADSRSRAAHKTCWDKQLPQPAWAIPE